MRAHFFDFDVIVKMNSKVWIVDKNFPNIPLLKISEAEFNLIRNGIYRSQGNSINFSGTDYWIPTELFNRLKIKSKKHEADFSNLGFSLQEFMNKELMENIEFEIKCDNILHLKNCDDHIYIICSKNSKKNYEKMIEKLEDKLLENGLSIKKYYHISETFYNRNQDDIAHKKVRLLLQHAVGYKTDVDKFTDEKLEQYEEIFYYDDEINSVNLSKNSNLLLKSILDKTEQKLSDIIKNELKEKEHILNTNHCTDNKMNKFISTKTVLGYSNLIKSFESFKWRC
jgi:hypothetical protein